MSNIKEMYSKVVQDAFPETMTITLGDQVLKYSRRSWDMDGENKGLRYGENPDQAAALYRLDAGQLEIGGQKYKAAGQSIISALSEAQMLQAGKHPGKTNLTDVDNGINILQYLSSKPAAVILKHNNPCGAAWQIGNSSFDEVLNNAYYSDRIAAFGGAVVVNRALDKSSAEMLAANYFEVIAAPEYDSGVLEILAKRKNLRVLQLPALAELNKYAYTPFLDIKSLTDGGLVLQQSFINRIRSVDDFLPATATDKEGNSYIARSANKKELENLLFAWAVEAGVSSNSVIFARNGATVAIGTGEQDRVGCVELTIHKAATKYADNLSFERYKLSIYELQLKAKNDPEAQENLTQIYQEAKNAKNGLQNTVLISDGYFPFRDGVDLAMDQGVSAIAQPGGSIRDYEVIQAVNQAKPAVAMHYTAQRSFKH